MAPTRLSERPVGGRGAVVVGSLKGYQSRAAKLFLIKRIMHVKTPWCTLAPHQLTKVVIKKRAKGFRGIWLVSFDVSVCGHTGKKNLRTDLETFKSNSIGTSRSWSMVWFSSSVVKAIPSLHQLTGVCVSASIWCGS